MTGGRTDLSPNEYGCLACNAIKTFINLMQALFMKSQNFEFLSWNEESTRDVAVNNSSFPVRRKSEWASKKTCGTWN